MTEVEVTALATKIVEERAAKMGVSNDTEVRAMIDAALKEQIEQNREVKAGDRPARIIRALGASKGDLRRAAEFAEKTLHDPVVAKALATGTVEGGGFLVPEEFSQEIIELLRPRSVVRSAGPVMVPMTTGVLTMPRLAAGASATYSQEGQGIKGSQEKGQTITLTWKKLTSLVPISNDLLRFSSPSADSMVREDLIATMATAEDKAFLRADGTASQPRGLRYWAPTGNVNATAAGSNTLPTLANVDTDLKLMTNLLGNADVRMIRPTWFMSPRSKNFFQFLRTANGPLAYPSMSSDNPTLLSYPVKFSNNIPNNLGGSSTDSEIYFVDMADVLLGESSSLLLEVSQEAAYLDASGTMQAAFSNDQTLVRAIQRHDMIMRHDASMAVLTAVFYN